MPNPHREDAFGALASGCTIRYPSAMTRIRTQRQLTEAMTALAAVDEDIARALAKAGPPPMRKRAKGFPSLLQTIVGQQVSTASARAIWGRLVEAVDEVAPEAFLALDDDACRAIGLSRQKILYGRCLAEAIAERRLDLEALERADDDDAIEALVALKGIGRWTAHMYLLFALRRADIWPVDDLAVVVATQRLKGLAERPKPKEMEALSEPWRPWRSAAALFMWHFYRQVPPGEWE